MTFASAKRLVGGWFPSTEPEKKVCTWSGDLNYCSCLPVLPGPAWVLLSNVLHTFISGSVEDERNKNVGVLQ